MAGFINKMACGILGHKWNVAPVWIKASIETGKPAKWKCERCNRVGVVFYPHPHTWDRKWRDEMMKDKLVLHSIRKLFRLQLKEYFLAHAK